jgi:hypothetical protein
MKIQIIKLFKTIVYFNRLKIFVGYILLETLSRDTVYIRTPRPGLMQVGQCHQYGFLE